MQPFLSSTFYQPVNITWISREKCACDESMFFFREIKIILEIIIILTDREKVFAEQLGEVPKMTTRRDSRRAIKRSLKGRNNSAVEKFSFAYRAALHKLLNSNRITRGYATWSPNATQMTAKYIAAELSPPVLFPRPFPIRYFIFRDCFALIKYSSCYCICRM